MSGLCGVLSRSAAPPDVRLLHVMEEAAPHRGGGWTGRCLSSGMALAYLNRTDSAPALVRHPETGVAVAVDARIDNRRELRSLLGSDLAALKLHEPGGGPPGLAAHTLRRAEDAPPLAEDARLILAAYLQWGRASLARLVGDFAVLVWDPRRRVLLLARDPMAMRALYYRVEYDRLLVATEAKQILALPGVRDDPDERMAACYLMGGFGSPEWSYFRGIRQVPPAHVVLVGERAVRTHRFWDVDTSHRVTHRSLGDYAEHFREVFVEAVRARMGAGRPAGVLLSGGVDSGAAASAAGLLNEREALVPALHSYSWDFGSFSQCDERHISRHIVDRYGFEPHDVAVEDAGPLCGYPEHPPDPDDPFHGHFQVILDRAFTRARNDGVDSLFTGARGDLAAGPIDLGYGRLLRERRWSALRAEVRRLRELSNAGMLRLARRHLLPVVRTRVRRTLRGGRRSSAGPRLPPWVHPELAERVGLPELLAEYEDTPSPPLDGPFRRRRYQWIFAPMHLRFAVSHERRVARHGMTAVDPWSDRRVAEFCVAVPQQVLDPDFSLDKPFVREAMRGVMPDEFRMQARKTAPLPLYEETLRGRSAPTVRKLLEASRSEARGWLRPAPLADAFERFVQGGRPPPLLWWALSLEWWLRERESTPRPEPTPAHETDSPRPREVQMRHERSPRLDDRDGRPGEDPRKPYVPPELEDFGTVAELTGVGLTNPGSDSLPGAARGRDGGSVHPSGLD